MHINHEIDCEDGDVKLVGGASGLEGTVEVCLDNLWGLVAEAGWTQVNAQVVCQQLGFPLEGNAALIYSNFPDLMLSVTMNAARQVCMLFLNRCSSSE